jgi:hypothetical protein
MGKYLPQPGTHVGEPAVERDWNAQVRNRVTVGSRDEGLRFSRSLPGKPEKGSPGKNPGSETEEMPEERVAPSEVGNEPAVQVGISHELLGLFQSWVGRYSG